MEAKKLNHTTVEDYLAIEQEGDMRYEYHNGEIFAMAGGTINHSFISVNIINGIYGKLLEANSPCFTLNSDVKLHIASERRFLYPDAMVFCEDVERSTTYQEAVTNPIIIIEVLSMSTASYDRGDKFYFYRQIKSLKEYVLIEQDKAQIEIYRRMEGEFWSIKRVTGLDAQLTLAAINVELPLEAIYRNVSFPEISKD